MGRDGCLGTVEDMVLLVVGRGGGAASSMTVRHEIEERAGREVTIGVGVPHPRTAREEAPDRVELRCVAIFASFLVASRLWRGARSMRAGLWDEVGLANMARDARESTWVAVRLGLLPFPTRVF